MLIEINKVKVNDRIRKDFGNIEELATDIKENGLINPPVVTPEYELIAGERRLRALKHLGYKQIEVRVMSVNDSEHQLKIEISENENRKEFTFSERIDWARRLERVEKIKSNERMLNPVQNSSLGKTRDIVAEQSGFGSHDTYNKAKYISENADEELIKQLDDGKLSINKAYTTLKFKAQQLENDNNQLISQLKQALNKPPIVVDNTDNSKINSLQQDITNKNKQIDYLNREKDILDRKVKLNEQEVSEYEQLKKSIDMLKSQQNDINRKIESATSISGLVVDIENLLQTKLAPVKYSRAISEQADNKIVIDNVIEIVNRVEEWCYEMKTLVNTNENIINVEVM